MNLKEQILGAADHGAEKHSVPEWGCDVYLRVMSGTERNSWELATFRDGKADRTDFLARLLVYTICDEHGTRQFIDDDAPQLSGKSQVVLLRLYERSCALNAIGKKEVDDIAKN